MKPLDEIIKINNKAAEKELAAISKSIKQEEAIWTDAYKKGFIDGYHRAAEEFRAIIQQN